MSAPAVVVIGAGSVGANVAYRLAQRGATVTVVEADRPGGGTSGASFAWLNRFGKRPRAYHDLNAASMDAHAALAEELGEGTWLHRDGALTWREDPAERAQLRETVGRLGAWRYPVELLSRHAARGGARLLHGDPVTGLLQQGVRVRGVSLASGTALDADWVVSCAGPATDRVLGLAGFALPLANQAGRLVYTTPVAATLRRPVHAPRGHFRPDGGGRIVLSAGHHDHAWQGDAGAAPPPEQSLAALAAHLPALAGARVEATRVGVRPIPQDGLPAVGPVPGREGFYAVVSHSAVTLGRLWGQLVAAEILDARGEPRLEPFRPARFAGRDGAGIHRLAESGPV